MKHYIDSKNILYAKWILINLTMQKLNYFEVKLISLRVIWSIKQYFERNKIW